MDWYRIEVNPEPWAIGPLGVGRRNGKPYPYVGRNDSLYSYQQAVKEGVENPRKIEGLIQLSFYFWRELPDYRTERERKHRSHEADLTNLIKATEDALQEVLFDNDRDVGHHEGWMIQGPTVDPLVIVGIAPFSPPVLPDSVRSLRATSGNAALSRGPGQKAYDQIEDIF